MKSRPAPHLSAAPSALDAAAIDEAAAGWLVRRQAGIGADDEVRFQAWLATDPRCGAALAKLERAWETISYVGRTGQSSLGRDRLDALQRARRYRRLAVGSLGLAAAASLVVALWSPRSPAVDSAPAAVPVAIRPDRQVLPDGSLVERNARTDIEIAFSPRQRLVRLIRGEALFTVVHDPARPFLVVAGGVGVRAVGTEFSVRYEPQQVNVLVTAGKVAVTKIAPAAALAGEVSPLASTPALLEPVYVVAGRHVTLPVDLPPAVVPDIKPLASEEISAALAWRGKRLEFTRTPLWQVAELFNRQNHLQFSIDDAATRALRITGLFWADDPEGFARLLESGFNVTAERSGDLIRLRQK